MSRRINVLQVVDKLAVRGASIHGVSRLLLSWWPKFELSDINQRLCVFRASEGGGDKFEEAGIELIDLNRSKFDLRTVLDLIRIVRTHEIHVLHCHGYGATTFGRLAGVLTSTPVIVHEHMIDQSIPSYQQLTDLVLGPFTGKGIAISRAVGAFMRDRRHIPAAKMTTVYNGIPEDSVRSYSTEERERFAQKYGFRLDSPIIGIVGRLDPIKGHADFIEAASRLASQNPSLQFAIVGDGELEAELKELACARGIESQVVFTGHQDEVLEIMSLFDVLVCCSHSEGLGMVVAEAMALQKPVVGTRVGGIPEILLDGVTGILVESRNVAQIVQGVQTLLSNEDMASAMGRAGLKVCREKFLVGSAVEALSQVYESLLPARG